MSDFRWTGEQAAAIQAEGHTLLTAGAGTGKTTTVIGKILWHLGLPVGVDRESGEPIAPCPAARRVRLGQVAAITFTEKAAYDLKRKLREEIEARKPEWLWELDDAAIGTIHGFCGALLREHALRLGIDPGFRVLDEREAQIELDEIIRDVILASLAAGDDDGVVAIVGRYGLEGYRHSGGRNDGAVDFVRAMVHDLRWHPDRYAEWADGDGLDAGVLEGLAGRWSEKDDLSHTYCAALYRLARAVIERWARYQEEENVRDFDSLILDARRLLSEPAGRAALEGIRRRYRLFIIDEFQDTDVAQRDIAFAIAGLARDEGAEAASAEPPQLFLVGDPKQSIYRFRHADVAVWNEVKEVMKERGRLLELTCNFRSDPAVVGFVNRFCGPTMAEAAEKLETEAPASRVEYSELRPDRQPSAAGGVEWLDVDPSGSADDRREREAEMVAARIRDIVVDRARGDRSGAKVIDPETGVERDCAYRDVAILFRTRSGIEHYERALQRYGVPYYLAGDAGLEARQEILDLLNVLRLIDNPRDDLRAFAYLRSPFVGLRDEVIARLRLDRTVRRGGTLLQQARAFVENGAGWFAAPEHPRIAEVEREALSVGIEAIEAMSKLRSRLPVDQLLEEVIERTGYREHLLLMDRPEPRLANIDRFLRFLEGYRGLTIGRFLEVWARWEEQGPGLPQAPLYSRADNVVTLSTIHSAKGLEWPVVFLVDTHGEFRDNLFNTFWSDRALGPILCLKQNDRGDRSRRLHGRAEAEDRAEETRVLYVAATRARDRLVITAPRTEPEGAAEWLSRGLADDVTVTSAIPAVEIPPPAPEPEPSWLDGIEPAEAGPLVAPLRIGRRRRFRSATELMAHARSRCEWKLKYWHGVTPRWYFARDSRSTDEVPPWIRGVVIHGVLERLQDEAELADLLEEAIGALDSPELEELMAAGTAYREALEAEIARVVRSDEWKWYVEGEHDRELPFVELVSPHKWRVGAFDLFRPGDPVWIIDFKTHEIGPDEVEATARKYRLQALLYRSAAERLAGGDARVRFHFTRPNAAVEVNSGE